MSRIRFQTMAEPDAPAAGKLLFYVDSADGNPKVKDSAGVVTDLTAVNPHALASTAHTADTLANLNALISDATLIDTGDARLSNSRRCDNTFDDAATSRTNLGVYSTSEVDAKVVGLYDHKGAYDAAANSPDLDVSPSGVLKGDAYTVSVAGSFFSEAVEVGDVLIADQDAPTLLTHWTRVNKNLSFGSTAGTACEGNDARLSDSRTPTSHAATHTDGTDDIQDATAAQKGLATAAQIAKLDGIETAATADQTGAEIKTAYEAEADTNAFTDADHSKLDGIEAGADVTDAENVGAAGAVMDSDISASEGFLRKTGAGSYEALKSNLNAAVAPGATDDGTAGYSIGSIWIDTTADKVYQCVDATASAAVWINLSGEANTSSNQGAGEGTLALPKSALDLPFKTIKQGASITVTNNANDVTIAASAATESAAGTLEIATQSEVDAGIDDVRALTPLKLKNYTGTLDGRDVSADGSKLDGIEAGADVTDAANVDAAGAVMNSDIAEGEGFVRKTGAGAYKAVKSNLNANTAPTSSDDKNAGYTVGSIWINTSTNKPWTCVKDNPNNAVWQNQGAGGTGPAGPAGPAGPIQVSFGNDTMSGSSINSPSYTVVRRLRFSGTSKIGTPTKIVAICNQSASTGSIRVYDATNAKTICEIDGFTETVPTLKDMGAISNLSAGAAIWEVQLKRSGGGSTTCHALEVEF